MGHLGYRGAMVASQLRMTAKEAFKSFTEIALATIHVVDHDVPVASRAAGMVRLSTLDNEELTAELDGASEWLGAPTDELLLAALARTIAKTLGEGIVPIDVASERASLLDAVPVMCVTAAQASATDILRGVHNALASAAEHTDGGMSEVYFNYLGQVPDSSVPVPVQETPPGLGHALEMRVYRTQGLIHVDWWYDTSYFEPYTIEELAEQFPLALYEMTTDALPAV
ncbi:hypothetical protein MGALJ_12720 [Mycobacterium gallinarum]|uniref:Polyketide synthase n=1 Tax=Mycobacterium gallinarum TaxID=39689 RepID=A0A9W4B004_9MYCO|nr:hypothetical protein MGALJ_12720 [Mycobacterium gallinarum]